MALTFFAKWNSENDFNIGPGKQHPGISLLLPADKKDIPVLFAANSKASMTSTILKDKFQKMDELCITRRGVDEKGITYCPAAVIDGHISRMGEDFLRYVNEAKSCWEVNLGASYGTKSWQLHDNMRQNGAFKSELASSKPDSTQKKIGWVTCRNLTLQDYPRC